MALGAGGMVDDGMHRGSPGRWSLPVRVAARSGRNGNGVGGTYREIMRPERIVHTEQFDQPMYPGQSVITTVLTEKGGKTTFTATILFESRTARDTLLSSGMERGAAASYDKLEQVLQSQGQIT